MRRLDLRGTMERALGGGRGANPSWSPSGTEVAFDDGGIFVAAVGGNAKRRLTPPSVHTVGRDGGASVQVTRGAVDRVATDCERVRRQSR